MLIRRMSLLRLCKAVENVYPQRLADSTWDNTGNLLLKRNDEQKLSNLQNGLN